MNSRALAVHSMPPPGQMMALYHAQSDFCQYSVTLDFHAGTIAINGPGLHRTYSLESQPFLAILEADNGGYSEIAAIAVLLAEAQVTSEDLDE